MFCKTINYSLYCFLGVEMVVYLSCTLFSCVQSKHRLNHILLGMNDGFTLQTSTDKLLFVFLKNKKS